MHRVLCELRISDVALHTVHGQPPAEGSAAAHFDRVAYSRFAGGLAYHAPVDPLLARRECLYDALRPIDRRTFLIARDQKRDRSLVSRMSRDEFLRRSHHRREA